MNHTKSLLLLLFLIVSINAQKNDGFWNFVPEIKASVFPETTSTWTGSCFAANKAFFTMDNKGGTLTIQTDSRTQTLCSDLYLIATNQNWYIRDYLIGGSHTVTFTWKNEAEFLYAQQYGIQVFAIQDGALGALADLVKTLELFVGPWTKEESLKFFKDYMNVTFTPRKQQYVELDESEIMNGEFLAILKLEAENAGLHDMICYGTGGVIGHAATTLWMDGQLYVIESTQDKYADGIVKTPWKKWMQQARESNFLTAMLRLSPELRAKFDVNKAIDFFKKHEGLPYGFHNFIFGWIDTAGDNYPPPVSKEIMPMLFQVVDVIDPFWSDRLWGQGLNKRLNTTGLNIYELFLEMAKRNISFYDVMAMVEQDDWVYSDGQSRVCSSFVMSIYKAAGIFDGLDIQATEITPRDGYSLEIYEKNWNRPTACNVDKLPYCQLTGEYLLDLGLDYNSVKPYTHMFERCGAQPPDYQRKPDRC